MIAGSDEAAWVSDQQVMYTVGRARRPATFQALGGAVAPNFDKQLELD